ncbi:tRNA pseudouridine(13) synthase TruD [Marinobacter mobilis]|uniref:tRNA pseudouridine(13) synthase TruD n=1 Tax=Marinobacter mobilis TaxID=488533 RepID=UPI0035C6F9B4
MSDQNRWRLDWPVPAPGRIARAVLKASPATFFVDEDLGLPGFPGDIATLDAIPLGGDGEHLCLRLEKRGDNTDYVARELAALAGCRHHDVGYCGLKDRHAVTRQWFSLYRPGQEEGDRELIERISQRWTVLAGHRHARKLRRGDHQGNAFVITLTGIEGDQGAIDSALAQVRALGCPNYFGPQRFGHEGGNLDRAIAMDPRRSRSRGRRGQSAQNRDGLYFSAARSWLFNEVLAARVEQGSWLDGMAGEPDPDMATGPLWGDGGTVATEAQEILEREVVAGHPEMEKVFASTRMKPERRPLKLMPKELSWQWNDDDSLTLRFALLPGQFATAVIGSVFRLYDAGGDSGVAEDR